MSLLSSIYCFFANLHRGLYHSGIIKNIKVKKPVLSVGNLTFGGTGKTPFVKMLVKDVKNLGLKPAIVTRSYKAKAVSSTLLDKDKAQHPEIWGDEACWYYHQLEVPVYSGPRKWESALMADQNSQIDFIILDDGFQHHKLRKNFDLVLIDAVSGLDGLRKRSRESLSTLKFADAIILTKANLVEPDEVLKIKKALPENKPLFLNYTKVSKLRDLNGKEIELKAKKVGLVSGLANPSSFYTMFKQKYPEVEVFKMDFSDHHDYQQEDLKKIEIFKTENNLELIIMTEKDEIKLKSLIQSVDKNETSPFGVLQIESHFENQKEWAKHLTDLIQ